MIDLEKYYDEYEYLYEDEPAKKKIKIKNSDNGPRKKKVKNFSHSSKQDLWDEFIENSDEDFGKEIMKDIKREEKKKSFQNSKPINKPASNISSTSHIIRGTVIDFSNVSGVVKVENVYNGNKTFGVKFIFKKATEDNKTFRIVWFNQNQEERDKTFVEKSKYWSSLKLNKNN